MSDLVRGYGEMRRVHGGAVPSGRHAFDEDAALTPIFHALNRGGGWRRRQQPEAPARRGDAVDEFRRDPLTAPIPVQALTTEAAPPAAVPARGARRRRGADTGAHALVEPREGGRHHVRLEAAGHR